MAVTNSVSVPRNGPPLPTTVCQSYENDGHGRYTENTLIASSPRWLITLMAIRPDLGFENGRDVLLRSVAQACRSISALRVVFKAL